MNYEVINYNLRKLFDQTVSIKYSSTFILQFNQFGALGLISLLNLSYKSFYIFFK